MSITSFFAGKQILITGGSGFIGKALIEKLLRSCDDIKTIYVLIREKKGQSPVERLKTITNNVLFTKLKSMKPEVLTKLIPIYGDVKEYNLALSEEDRRLLIENVNIIYHGAASVKFDDFLKDAILLNTRGTREVVNLALEMKNLVAFVHISTTYCNTDKKIVEEKIYPAHADWRASIKIAEEMDQHLLDVLATKYIDPLPNTYTFAKSLGEHVVNDLCKGKIPTVIFRPSVVISSYTDPMPGWIDNFNGPAGLLLAGGKGLVKISYGAKDVSQDYLPVDVMVKMMIIATLKRNLNKDLNEVEVYNGSAGKMIKCTNGKLIKVGESLTWTAPCKLIYWFPSCDMTNNWYLYFMGFLVYHLVPALFVDGLLKLIGRQPMLVRIQRKIYIANMALIFFLKNAWYFVNNKVLSPSFYSVIESEQEAFSYFDSLQDFSDDDLYTYLMKSKTGGMYCLFKEKFDFAIAYRNAAIMWILDRLMHFSIYGFGCWYLIVKIGIFTLLSNKFNDFVLYWNNL